MHIYIISFFILLFPANSYASGVLKAQQELHKTKQLQVGDTVSQKRTAGPERTAGPVQRIGASPRIVDPDYVSASRSGYAEEVVDIEDLWYELESSSEIWNRIIEEKPKEATINMYIDWYDDNGIKISKPADSYVKIIDDLVAKNPAILQNPFKDILKIAAIIEYDFDNGQDKDVMAQKVLGEEAYKKNKQRLGK